MLMREVLRKPLRTPRELQQRLTPRFLRYSRAAMQQLVQMGVHLLELPPGEFRQFSDNVLWAHSLSMVAQAQASDKHAGEGLLIARPRDYATMDNQNKAESRNQKAKIRSTSPRPPAGNYSRVGQASGLPVHGVSDSVPIGSLEHRARGPANRAAIRKASRLPCARNPRITASRPSSPTRKSSRMNQKQRVWKRVKACCASASLSGEADRAATEDGSFTVEIKTKC